MWDFVGIADKNDSWDKTECDYGDLLTNTVRLAKSASQSKSNGNT